MLTEDKDVGTGDTLVKKLVLNEVEEVGEVA